MSGINIHTLLGNVGQIETRYTQDGKPVVNMSIATSKKWKNKQTGELNEKTDWNRVVIFGNLADIASKYVFKGDKIFLQGKVVTRKWQDQSGVEKYTTETVVDGFNGKIELLGNKDNTSTQQQPAQQQQQQQPQQQQQQPQQQPALQDEFDIPF